ncbi:MAG: thermonuclease family protein [Panacagrimonas sp.]|jgi:endonuclease YncB( thermonuclease family)|nr:thermonuclease family protein [Panacagrimonas sp.]MCC2655029.1 thermonuclease family protein [Panacagrimonas sp.]
MQRDDSALTPPSSISPAPRRQWWPRVSAAFLPVLILGFSASFGLARADSDDKAITGKATVIKQGVIEVKDQKFRLFGISNPGGGQSCHRGAKPWNCGEAARTALRQHVEGHKVRCVPEEKNDRVARCTMGDVDLSALLVREGWARADRDESGKKYVEEEKEAKKARRGIWADDDNPEEVRRQQQRNY